MDIPDLFCQETNKQSAGKASDVEGFSTRLCPNCPEMWGSCSELARVLVQGPRASTTASACICSPSTITPGRFVSKVTGDDVKFVPSLPYKLTREPISGLLTYIYNTLYACNRSLCSANHNMASVHDVQKPGFEQLQSFWHSESRQSA